MENPATQPCQRSGSSAESRHLVERFKMPLVRAKAAWRCASRRSPRHARAKSVDSGTERDSVSRSNVDGKRSVTKFHAVWVGEVAAGRRPALRVCRAAVRRRRNASPARTNPGVREGRPVGFRDGARLCESQQRGWEEKRHKILRRLDWRSCCGSQTRAPGLPQRATSFSAV